MLTLRRHLPPIAIGLFVFFSAPAGAEVQRSAAAANATDAGLLAAISSFRTDLGGVLNPNAPGSVGSGRREINWDAVPQTASSPNAFPADFFNGAAVGRARGVVFSTPGTGFQVSANDGEGPVQFSNIDPNYPTFFEPFSAQKLFTPIGSTITDVNFFVPGSNVPALSSGFGAVFSDVDIAGSSSIEYFDANGASLGSFPVASIGGNQTFSFLGVSFGSPVISRVRITSGNQVLAAGNTATDLVVLDDFIYGEPTAAGAIPEPSTLALLASGIPGLLLIRRRRA